MARKRRKAPKIELHPMFRWIRGRMGRIVYRLAHNVEISAYPAPDMSGIEWSQAQKAQRWKFANASAYATLVIQYPDLRQYYVELAKRLKRNPRRPGDVAFSDYFKAKTCSGRSSMATRRNRRTGAGRMPSCHRPRVHDGEIRKRDVGCYTLR